MDEITPGRLAVIIPCSFQRRKETELTKLYIPWKCTWSPVRQGTSHLCFRLSTLSAVWLTNQQRDTDSSFGAEAAASPCDSGSAAPSKPTKQHFFIIRDGLSSGNNEADLLRLEVGIWAGG